MADVQLAIIDQQNTEVTIAVPGVQGATGQTGDVAVAQDGTQGTPGIRFENDPNTGIYRPDADQLAISTGGTQRISIGSDGDINIDSGGVFYDASTNRLAVGTTGPETRLHVQNNSDSGTQYLNTDADILITASGTKGAALKFENTGGATESAIVWDSGKDIKFTSRDLERARIDSSGTFYVVGAGTGGLNYAASFSGSAPVNSLNLDSSGRLLVGTDSSLAISTAIQGQLQIADTNVALQSISNFRDSVDGPYLAFGKSRGASIDSYAVVESDDQLGTIRFSGADGTDLKTSSASIAAFVDGTPAGPDPGPASMPGRLVFSTTSSGSTSPTPRMRIDSAGNVSITNSSTNSGFVITSIGGTSSVFAGTDVFLYSNRTASSSFKFLQANSDQDGSPDVEFIIRGDGNAYADGSWNGGGADYAEYFEWSDSNLNEEDRRGISVVLDGDKIREAQAGEDPIGVVSGNPSVVGDAAWNKWSGKYLRDEFGTYILEDYEVTDDDGNTVIQQRRKLNPSYDPDQEYIPREQRPEWDCVGLMGKLRIRKGQVTGSRWIKMRDISDSVEEWLVR